MAATLKMLMRTLGLVWIGLLGILAWEYVPQFAAVAAPAAPRSAQSVREAPLVPETPSIKTPRVVYQGTINAVANAERRAPATTQTAAPTGQERPAAVALVVTPPPTSMPTTSVVAAPAPPVTQVASLPDLPVAETAKSAGRVNLNTASVADLNGLGAGMIGRAIVAGRPYRDAEDLLSKRVLNRSTFARIKDQVAAR